MSDELKSLARKMRDALDDPMWADHVELSKGALKTWLAYLEHAIAQPAEEVQPVGYMARHVSGAWNPLLTADYEGIARDLSAGWSYQPVYSRPPAADADRLDAERLEWVSHAWGGQRHDYANHVLSRGGDGDLSDIRTFIDKHLPARVALAASKEKKE